MEGKASKDIWSFVSKEVALVEVIIMNSSQAVGLLTY